MLSYSGDAGLSIFEKRNAHMKRSETCSGEMDARCASQHLPMTIMFFTLIAVFPLEIL